MFNSKNKRNDSNDKNTVNDKVDMVDEKKKWPVLWIVATVVAVIVVVGANTLVSHYLGHNRPSKDDTSTNYDLSALNLGTPLAQKKSMHPISALHNVVQHTLGIKTDRDVKNDDGKEKERLALLRSPMFVNAGQVGYASGQKTPSKPTALGGLGDRNIAYLRQLSQSQDTMTYAHQLGDLNYIIGQGKVINGVLETPMNSDLPGTIRGHVTEDVYGDQGDLILIPNGSRLVGTYKATLQNGQSRLFVVWTRLQEPNGVIVRLDAPGSDALGQAGMMGYVNYHYLKRFASSVLLSILSAGSSTYGVSTKDQYNSLSSYRQAISSALANASQQQLDQNKNISPTININQGKKFSILVNKDISFKKVQLNTQNTY